MHLPISTAIIVLIILIRGQRADNVGWRSYFTENPTEFHDLLLDWEEDTAIPDWISGTYVKNGPAQVTFNCQGLYIDLMSSVCRSVLAARVGSSPAGWMDLPSCTVSRCLVVKFSTGL